jgi:hypothetical protein
MSFRIGRFGCFKLIKFCYLAGIADPNYIELA